MLNCPTLSIKGDSCLFRGRSYYETFVNHFSPESVTMPVENKRTNGPVNPHLISGHTISTKTSFAKFDIVVN